MDSILKKIIELDYIAVGSIAKTFRPCGKENCKCKKDKKDWHGPYYIWTRKENGKTISRSMSKKQAMQCKNAIKNMKKLKVQIEKWKKITYDAIDNI